MFSDLTPELWNAATNTLSQQQATAALQPAALTQIYQVSLVVSSVGVRNDVVTGRWLVRGCVAHTPAQPSLLPILIPHAVPVTLLTPSLPPS